MVNGFVWQQGKTLFFASWIPLIVCVLLTVTKIRRKWTVLLLIFFIAECCFISLFPLATIQWWVQVLLLAGFAWSLTFFNIKRRQIMRVLVWSMVPQLAFGSLQWFRQRVDGSSWLGMSAQDPLTRGVSVVEQAGQRFLRVYGGFPHPNVFGGWLALTFIAAFVLSCTESTAWRRWMYLGFAGWSSIVLVVTFSRSAWIAAALGMCGMLWDAFHANHFRAGEDLAGQSNKKRYLWNGECAQRLIILVSVIAITAWSVHPLLSTRVQGQARLEQLSSQTRLQSLRDGWTLFTRHPWFGVGPGVSVFALVHDGIVSVNLPVEPPHLVPLLALDECGLIGIGLLIFLVVRLRRGFIQWSEMTWWPLCVLIPLLSTDHFLWSLWSGQCLLMVAMAIVLCAEISEPITATL